MRICKKCLREIKNYPFCPFCGASQNSNLLTLEQIYSEWSTLYFRKVGRKSREGYENAWRTLRFLGQCAMSDIKINDYQLAMDALQNKSRSLQNKLLLLIGQLCKYAVAVHRIDVINPSPYLILDGVQAKSREIFSDEEISRLFLYAQANERFSCTAREVLILIFTGLRPEELFEVEKNDVNLQYHFLFTWGSKTDAGKERIIPLISQIMPYTYLSLETTYEGPLGIFLDENPQIRTIYLAQDADESGIKSRINCRKLLEERGFTGRVIDKLPNANAPGAKDWNDALILKRAEMERAPIEQEPINAVEPIAQPSIGLDLAP